jgi:glycerophosphoryl diester phosphodiesterase
MDAVEIIAHRGSSFLAPENTCAAVELAWREGADAVEGDFQLTADGRIVAMHNATLLETAGVDRRVCECSLAELRTYDVGSWKGAQFANERIPTLEKLLATVPSGKRYYVEIKCGAEIISELSRVVSACGLAPEQIVPICLDLSMIASIKRSLPQYAAYWVVECLENSHDWNVPIDEVFREAAAAGIDGLDLDATGPIDAELVRRANSAGLRLCVWTVDDPVLAQRLIDLGIEGITTNRPGWLRQQLAK